jgi:ABC-type sugar transport system permease subunit
MGMDIYNASKKLKVSFKKQHYSVMEKKDFPFVILLLAFPIAQILLCWVYVNIQSIFLAFTDGAGNISTASIERVINALVQRRDHNGFDIIALLGKSTFIWCLGTFTGYTICMFTTYMLAKHTPGDKIFRIIYMVPGLVGGVVMSTIWKEFFAGGGAMVTMLQKMGADLPRQVIKNGLLGHESTAFATIMIKDTLFGLAGGGMILTGAFMRIPQDVFESAELDGCGFFRETFQIAIPCAWPTISTMFVFGMTGMFTADAGFYLYSDGTGKFGMQSIGYYMYSLRVTISEVKDATYLYGYVSAFGMFLTVITLPLVLFSRWLLGKMQEDVGF